MVRALWKRAVYLLLEGHIDLVESGMGLALSVRGVWMMYYANAVPADIQGLVFPFNLDEMAWGLMLVVVGVTQIGVSLCCVESRKFSRTRAVTSTLSAVMLTYALIAYWTLDLWYRAAVPFVVTLLLGQMYLAMRGWKDAIVRR